MTGNAAFTDTASVGWTEARARRRRAAYQRLLGADLLLHLAVGLACLLAPQWIGGLSGQPAAGWIRGWGAAIILVCALQLPGLQDPLRSRHPNIAGVAGRFWLSGVWFAAGGGLILFALADLGLGVALGWLYYRYCIAEIMSRP